MDKAVWYYKIGEEKEGPISHNELQKKLDSGEIERTTKVWTESFQGWVSISDIEHFNMSSLDETPAIAIEKGVGYSRETDQEVVRPRPWIRFWARMIDYSLFFFVIGLFNLQFSLSGIVAMFLWVFVEALLISTTGITPGKWILRVEIRNKEGEKLSVSDSLNRSISVWWLGMGAGIPIVTLITMIVAAVKLNNTGVTTWDRRSEFKVLHGKVGTLRTMIVILYFLCYSWLLFWGQLQLMMIP